MRFLPHRAVVNEQALLGVIEAAEAFVSDQRSRGISMSATEQAIARLKINATNSHDVRCPKCHGAGLGNDGDTWDLSDGCSMCGGWGLILPIKEV